VRRHHPVFAPGLKAFWQTTAPELKLLRLSREAGVHLLKTLGVKGSELRNIPIDATSGSEAPKRAPPTQPRATPWVGGRRFISPEGAGQNESGRLCRPFRAGGWFCINPGRCPGPA